MKLINIIISVYNEEEGIRDFFLNLTSELKNITNYKFELIWVNDGSTDGSQSKINEITSQEFENINNTCIEFSKNFGHEAAMIAGIDNSEGDSIICMDADGQHPPNLIPEILNAFENNNDIVLLERKSREDNSFIKNFFSRNFYKTINFLSKVKFENNSTDFFLISKKVVKVFKENYRERNRFIRGFIQSVGFDKVTLEFDAPARLKGESNYSFKQLSKLAFNAIFTFSNKPLRISMLISVLFILFTVFLGAYTIFQYFFGNTPPSGYTTIVLFLSVSFSLLFTSITIASLYFEKALEELRQRPLYIIKNKKSK